MAMIIFGVALAKTAPLFSIDNPIGFDSVQGVVKALIQVAFMAAGIVAVIYLIIGGFKYVTSSGNPEAIESAKGTIVNAIIGLIIIFISSLLVNYILISLKIKPLYQLGVEEQEENSASSESNSSENNELPVPQ